ncbi:transcription elongation factor A N-terminal and central domain-containing protein [Ctenodactylus gundi]
MSGLNHPATRASLIKQLLSKQNFEDLGSHLSELEMMCVTKEHLQETDVVQAVYRVLKTCPSVTLKKKAKCLLSKWKALYKSSHFKPRDSSKACLSRAGREASAGPYRGQGRGEPLGACSSDAPPLSQDVANPTEMILPENDAIQMDPREEHPGPSDPQSTGKQAGEFQEPTVPVRAKCIELLHVALASTCADQLKVQAWQDLAREIEEHVFNLYSKNIKKYKTCIRSKVANLKNPRNGHLKQSLLSGTLSSRDFAKMTTMEMANEDLKQLRAAYTESCIQERHLPQAIEGTQTNKIKCRRCEKYNCKVTIISRGTLFLPSWVRNSNPDEQMMTYVICNECGEQWYHSKWVCL